LSVCRFVRLLVLHALIYAATSLIQEFREGHLDQRGDERYRARLGGDDDSNFARTRRRVLLPTLHRVDPGQTRQKRGTLHDDLLQIVHVDVAGNQQDWNVVHGLSAGVDDVHANLEQRPEALHGCLDAHRDPLERVVHR